MEELMTMAKNFATANGLSVRVAYGTDCNSIVFENKDGSAYYYRLTEGFKASDFPKIVEEVSYQFNLIRYDGEPVSASNPKQFDICGLTKQEYIALELTKAWASTRCNGHEMTNEILDTYEFMLKEVRERNL